MKRVVGEVRIAGRAKVEWQNRQGKAREETDPTASAKVAAQRIKREGRSPKEWGTGRAKPGRGAATDDDWQCLSSEWGSSREGHCEPVPL